MRLLKNQTLLKKGIALVLVAFLLFQSTGGLSLFAEESQDALNHTGQTQVATTSAFGLRAAPTPATLTKTTFAINTAKGSSPLENGDYFLEALSQKNSSLKIRYDFESPTKLKEDLSNKTFDLDLSSTEGLNFLALETGNPYLDSSGYFSYSYDSANKKIHVVFDEDKLPAQGAKAYIELNVSFALDQDSTDNQKEFVFPVTEAGQKAFTLRFLPNNIDETLSKKGEFISSTIPGLSQEELKINPHEIKWTVDLNKKLEAIPQANSTWTDTFDPDQLAYHPGSFELHRLNIALNGQISQGAKAIEGTDYNLDIDPATGKMKLNFIGNQSLDVIKGQSYLTHAYRITYVTDIKDDLVGKDIPVLNTAHLNKQTATDTLTISQKVADKSKKTVSYVVQYTPYKAWLRWTVDVNLSQHKLDKFEDVLQTKLKLIPFDNQASNKKVRLYKIKPESLAKDTFNELDDLVLLSDTDFDSQFTLETAVDTKVIITPKAPSRDAYRIVFDTEILPGQDRPYENTATSHITKPSGPTTTVSNTAQVKKGIASAVSKAADKTVANDYIDYTNNTIRWRIHIEPKTGLMKNLVITDTFPQKGLTFIEDDFSVMLGSTSLIRGTDYDLDNKGDGGFVITFKGTYANIRDKIKILYKTRFTPAKHNLADIKPHLAHIYENKIDYAYNNEDDSPVVKEATVNAKVHPYVPYNGGKDAKTVDGDRTIAWVIYANYNGNPITTTSPLTLVDEIPDGHVLVEDSIQVKHFDKHQYSGRPSSIDELAPKPTAASNEYNISGRSPKGFTVQFTPHASGKLYAITFKTQLSDEKSREKYVNVARINQHRVEKVVNFADYNKFVLKKGQQRAGAPGHPNRWYVDWSVNLNKSLSYMADAVIKDSLSPGQEYVADSIKVFTLYPGKTQIPESDYDVVISPFDPTSGQQSMQIKFKNPVRHEYVLEYASLITDIKAAHNIKNTVEFGGQSSDPISQGQNTAVSVVLTKTDSGSQPKSAYGSITIVKKNHLNHDPISGITFELWKNGNKLVDFLPTDSSGKTTIKGLVVGDYTLKEVAHPDYQAGNEVSVTISDTRLDIETEITNLPKGKITLNKVDNTGAPLAGVVFELYQAGNKVASFPATDAGGQTSLAGLAYGDYTIKETSTPPNYIPADDFPVSIKGTTMDDTHIVKTVTNYTKGSITLTKVNQVTNAPIAGIQFELWQGPNKIADFPLTGANGKTSLNRLDYGTYTIKEVNHPDYLPMLEFEIVVSKTAINPSQLVHNLPKGSITLTKVNQLTNAPIAGIQFELWQGPNKIADFPLTGANGKTSLNRLDYGTYTIKEIENPNYNPVADFNLAISSTNVNATLTVTNIPTGSITIFKKDKADNAPLKDIVFELWQAGSKVKDFPATDVNGQTRLSHIQLGTYEIREAVSSLYLPLAPITVNISETKLDVVENILNEKKPPLTPYDPSPNNPGDTTPNNPGDTTPNNPGDTTPNNPGDTTPNNPGDTTPNNPGDTTPNNPGDTTPNNPGDTTPSNPGNTTPDDPRPPIEGTIEIPDTTIPTVGLNPEHGKVVLEGNTWKYTPNKGFYGKDKFTLKLVDANGLESEEVIEIDIPIPKGIGALPKTDGIPPLLFFLFGGLLLLFAIQFKRSK